MKTFVVGVLELFAWLLFFGLVVGCAGAGYLVGADQWSRPFAGLAIGLFTGIVVGSLLTGTLFLLLQMRDLLGAISTKLDARNQDYP